MMSPPPTIDIMASKTPLPLQPANSIYTIQAQRLPHTITLTINAYNGIQTLPHHLESALQSDSTTDLLSWLATTKHLEYHSTLSFDSWSIREFMVILVIWPHRLTWDMQLHRSTLVSTMTHNVIDKHRLINVDVMRHLPVHYFYTRIDDIYLVHLTRRTTSLHYGLSSKHPWWLPRLRTY